MALLTLPHLRLLHHPSVVLGALDEQVGGRLDPQQERAQLLVRAAALLRALVVAAVGAHVDQLEEGIGIRNRLENELSPFTVTDISFQFISSTEIRKLWGIFED